MSSDLIALYVSIPALISVAPPATAPAPAPKPSADNAPAPSEAPPARFPAPRLIASIADFPRSPVPIADEPSIVAPSPISPVPEPNTVFPVLPRLIAPLPRLINGLEILLSITAENIDDKSADLPPGSSLAAFDTRLPSPSINFADTASKSKPSENPLANDAPMLVPSSNVSDISIPSIVITPILIPLPIPFPMSPANSANFAFPLVSHHSLNGSAMKASQLNLTLPRKSAFCHSSVLVSSSSFLFARSTFVSTQSIISSRPDSTAGI